nr:MAG TPA: hypothetical protein [Bacteriophage sp.]
MHSGYNASERDFEPFLYPDCIVLMDWISEK